MIRERDMDLATLVSDGSSLAWYDGRLTHLDVQESEVKDLASQLAYQTQTRLNITDKYDQVAKVTPRLEFTLIQHTDASIGPTNSTSRSHDREGSTPRPRRPTLDRLSDSQSH
jgi:hypothetical protein